MRTGNGGRSCHFFSRSPTPPFSKIVWNVTTFSSAAIFRQYVFEARFFPFALSSLLSWSVQFPPAFQRLTPTRNGRVARALLLLTAASISALVGLTWSSGKHVRPPSCMNASHLTFQLIVEKALSIRFRDPCIELCFLLIGKKPRSLIFLASVSLIRIHDCILTAHFRFPLFLKWIIACPF